MVTRVEKPAAETGRADEAFKESLAAFERQLDRRFEKMPLSRPEPLQVAADRSGRAERSTWSRSLIVVVLAAAVFASVSTLFVHLLKIGPFTAPPSPPTAVAARPLSVADILPQPPPAPPATPATFGVPPVAVPQQSAKAETPPAPAPRDRGRLSAAEVREVQARLAILGFDPGPADGAAGPQTSAAVRRFEEATGRPPTGAVDRETWTQLRNEPALQAGR